MKNLLSMSRLAAFCLFVLTACGLSAQVPYSYAPANPDSSQLAGISSGKNSFVQGLVLFDPAEDPALARMKGLQIKGVRCFLRSDYMQARQNRSAILASLNTPDNIVRTTSVDFTAGWNDVLFDEPLTIGDERIYLGLQVYETTGNPFPLVTFSPVSVPQSCLINIGKKSWEEYTDRGTLLVAALLEDGAASSLQHTAYAQNTTHPQTVAPDEDFEGGLNVHNFSPETLTSIELSMQGEGAETITRRVLQLPQPVEGYGSAIVTTALRAGKTEGTNVTWTATVSRFNDDEAQNGRPGTTRLYVTYDNFIRTPLVEEFTSQRCVACPQMAYFLEKAFQQYEGPYVYVSHHSGFAEDVFTSAADEEVVYVFGGYKNEYNPAIMYNRTVFEGENTIVQGIRDMSPTPYLEALAVASAMPAMAAVNVKAADGQVTVSGRVARDLVQTPLYLSCYLVEDGISAQRYPQVGLTGDATAPADLQDVFRHNGVILHYFTAEAIGDLLDVQSDGTYSVTYPAVQPEGFGGTARRIVAFVHRINKDNLRENAVLNATQMELTTGIGGVQADRRPTKDGNPVVYDLCGRRANLKKGIYLVNGKKMVVSSVPR